MQNIVLVTQVAISMITPIFLGLFIGSWLDNKIGTSPWFTLILLILGVFSGFLNTYKLIMGNKTKKGNTESGRK